MPAAGLIAEPPFTFPSLAEAARVWLRIGLLSFGGPAGQIALLHREVVDRRRWVGERRFLHALSFCALLPGPEAMQLATYLGWLMHGALGGLAAGLLFVLPGAAVMLGLSILYFVFGQVPAMQGAFFGLECAVLALVVQALLRIARRALHTPQARAAAVLAFVALFLFAAPFPAVVLGAALVGTMMPGRFVSAAHGPDSHDTPALIDGALVRDPDRPARMAAGARRAGAVALALWLAPVAWLQFAAPGRFADVAWFFSKMAVVTLGGAYAVLAYVAQDAVHSYHWLRPDDMLTGLGMAETTPGPLILVLQFVGFLAGARSGTGLAGMAGGLAGSAITLWVTFAPCLAFVFLGAPLVEQLSTNAKLSSALAAVTAAVVGVIANLALWFVIHLLFTDMLQVHRAGFHFDMPLPASLNLRGMGLSVLAAIMLFRFRLPVPAVLGISASGGLFLAEFAGVAIP